MTRRTALTAAAAAVLIGAGASTSAAVAPPAVQCGDVITGNVVLTADLVCPSGPYGLKLLVGATLDLGGHRVVGGAQRPGPEDPYRIGIEVPPNGGVTVRGGTVRGWTDGVSAEPDVWSGDFEPGHVTLEDLTLRENRVGLGAAGYNAATPEYTVTSSRIVANDYGISAWGAPRIVVEASRIADNGEGAQSTAGGGGIAVVESVVVRNGIGLRCDDGGFTVVGSTLRDNGTALECVEGGVGVTGSTVAGNDVGLDVMFDSSVDISGNVLRDNGTAVRLSNAHGTVSDNRFVRNDVAFVGISDWATVTIEGNEFRRNGDGILSVADGSAVGGNTAVRNERWGIHAPNAVDLGGNRAWGNGNEPQCVGVVCAGSGPVS